MRRLGLTLLAVVVTSGCFRSTTTITVKQDGSGVIDQEIGASAQAPWRCCATSSGVRRRQEDVCRRSAVRARAGAGGGCGDGRAVRVGRAGQDGRGRRLPRALRVRRCDEGEVQREQDPARPRGWAAEKAERATVCVRVRQERRHFRADDQHARAEAGRAGHAAEDAGQQRIARRTTRRRCRCSCRCSAACTSTSRSSSTGESSRPTRRTSPDRRSRCCSSISTRSARRMARCRSCSRSPTRGMLKDIPGVRMSTDPVLTIEFGR